MENRDMYDIVVGMDENSARTRAQVEAIVDMPAHEEIQAVLLHVFKDDGGSIEDIESIVEARTSLEDAGIEVMTETTRGDPAMGILDAAERHDADCICVAGRTRSPTGKAIFGSVTQDVIVGAERPTLVCHASEE